MSIQLVDSGAGSANPLSGSLNWGGTIDGSMPSMNRSGGGTIYANTSFVLNGNYWTVGAGGAYQYVEMTWDQDFGVGSFDSFCELYVCLANPGSGSVSGYLGVFYNDGSNLVCDFYDYTTGGLNYLGSAFGTLAFVGDTFALEFDGGSTLAAYQNGSNIGSITNATYMGQDGMGIGSEIGYAEFRDVQMEQPAGGAPQSVNLTGIASAAAFGTIQALNRTIPSLTGIASAEAFGTAGPLSQTVPGMAGIASAGAMGTIQSIDQQVSLSGIPSQEAFGGIGGLNEQVLVAGIPSGEAFGNVTIVGGTQSVGNPTRLLMTGAGN